jgi:hypothetical protein
VTAVSVAQQFLHGAITPQHIIIIIFVIGKSAIFEPWPSLEDCARFVLN